MQNIRLVAREEIARDTSVFWFEKPADFTFRAGQYTVLRLPNLSEPDPQGPVRSLSICSAPHEERLGFALRNTQSPFKKALWAMQPGEEASITPVIGKFVLEATETRPLVFIVGGIGITPVRSILKEATLTGSAESFTLLYANRSREDISFGAELRGLSLANFHYVDVLDHETAPSQGELDERGFIDAALLDRHVDNPIGSVYYVVGSPAFNEAMKALLLGLAIPESQIHWDAFTGLFSKREQKK